MQNTTQSYFFSGRLLPQSLPESPLKDANKRPLLRVRDKVAPQTDKLVAPHYPSQPVVKKVHQRAKQLALPKPHLARKVAPTTDGNRPRRPRPQHRAAPVLKQQNVRRKP